MGSNPLRVTWSPLPGLLSSQLTSVLFWQRAKELVMERQNLKLFRSPFQTLYYFFGSASSAAGRGLIWLLKHRITIFLLFPLLIGYLSLKIAGQNSSNLPKAPFKIIRFGSVDYMQPYSGPSSYQLPLCLCLNLNTSLQQIVDCISKEWPFLIIAIGAYKFGCPMPHQPYILKVLLFREKGRPINVGRAACRVHSLVGGSRHTLLHWLGNWDAFRPALSIPSHAEGVLVYPDYPTLVHYFFLAPCVLEERLERPASQKLKQWDSNTYEA